MNNNNVPDLWPDLMNDERGFFTLVVVTLALTALIGGVGLLAMVTTRQPVSGAMDRLDRNEATPKDMDTLQNAGKDMERTARIAAGAGSFIGGGGPVPNPAAPVGAGGLFPGDKAVAGIIPRVIGRLTNTASQPAQTGDNPLPPAVSGTGSTGSESGGYDPTRDPGMGAGSGPSVDPNIGSTFQGQVPGGTRKPPSGGTAMGGGQPTEQPAGYTAPTQPSGGQTTGPATQPPVYGPMGSYCPDGYYFGPGNSCIQAPMCPPNMVRGPDGRCQSYGGLLPPIRTGGSSSGGGPQPGTTGGCPPGCHVKKDGTGGCDCDEGGGTKTTTTQPATTPSTTTPPAKPPSTSRPTGGGGG